MSEPTLPVHCDLAVAADAGPAGVLGHDNGTCPPPHELADLCRPMREAVDPPLPHPAVDRGRGMVPAQAAE